MRSNRQMIEAVTRRGFLGRAGFAAAMLMIARIPAGAGAEDEAAAETPRLFNDDERRTLLAIIERMVFTGRPDAPKAADVGAIQTIERVASTLSEPIRDQLRWGLKLFKWGPLLFQLKLETFPSLDPEEQDANIRDWMTSRLHARRIAFKAFRNLAMMGYYAHESTWALIGYKGPWIKKSRWSEQAS